MTTRQGYRVTYAEGSVVDLWYSRKRWHVKVTCADGDPVREMELATAVIRSLQADGVLGRVITFRHINDHLAPLR